MVNGKETGLLQQPHPIKPRNQMALSEFEEALVSVKVAEFIEGRRPPKHLRNRLDLGFKIENQSIVIFEITPHFRNPGQMVEKPVAKTTYTKTSQVWKVYWQRADLKWHRYEPVPEVASLEEFLAVLDADDYGCFWG